PKPHTNNGGGGDTAATATNLHHYRILASGLLAGVCVFDRRRHRWVVGATLVVARGRAQGPPLQQPTRPTKSLKLAVDRYYEVLHPDR
ncbi:MAG: hypothetical protein ACRD2O_18370, partial [Terriglobia bacterium]